MRFMVIVKATKDSEAGKMPSEELLSAMAKLKDRAATLPMRSDKSGTYF